jgi:hypothetical protein
MFEIDLLPPDQLGADGQRLGRITIGDFSELFACYPITGTIDDLPADWRNALTRLVDGATYVALIHDPRFAWFIYRDGGSCFVQQILSPDGTFDSHSVRETETEDGERISEWTTSLDAISEFLAAT